MRRRRAPAHHLPRSDIEREIGQLILDLERERTGPSNVWERSHRARALLLRSDWAGNRGAFDAAVDHARAALALAKTLSASDQDDMERLLSARAQSELGQTLVRAGRAEEAALEVAEALPALERIMRQEPRHAQAQCELALACQRMALTLSGSEPELARTWQVRGRAIVDELERAQRLANVCGWHGLDRSPVAPEEPRARPVLDGPSRLAPDAHGDALVP